MSIATLSLIGIMLVAGFILRMSKQPRIYNISGDYELPWYERLEFSFRVSFPSREAAEKCASLVTQPNLSCSIGATPKGQRWVVTWKTSAFSSGHWYKNLSIRILRAAIACGDEDPIIVAAASKPSSGTALLLANYSIESLPASVASSAGSDSYAAGKNGGGENGG